MRNFVDLHTHSTASDGSTTPAELVALAERKHLAAIALTDHETTAGVPLALAAGKGLAVRVVPGVELSAPYSGGTMHILALGVDVASPPFAAALARMREWRNERNPKIIEKLIELGYDVSMEQLHELAGPQVGKDSVLGRLHIAMLLMRKGHVRTISEAFDKLIGYGRPAYAPKDRLESRQVLEVIHQAGGVAILAHPVQLHCANSARLEHEVRLFQSEGLDGIEVYHSDHSVSQTRQYLDLARKLGLLISGGSDFHGQGKADVRLGLPKVPLKAVEQLLARIAARGY